MESADTSRKNQPAPAPQSVAPAQSSASSTDRGNRIEVTGNTVSGTRCDADGATSVNSVNVAGARLEGRTVIVQGRNSNDVHTRDCPVRPSRPAQREEGKEGAGGQTNSIRIR